jgi:hypothetical protein
MGCREFFAKTHDSFGRAVPLKDVSAASATQKNDRHDMGSLEQVKEYYDSEIEEMVYNLYKEDFELYSYPRQRFSSGGEASGGQSAGGAGAGPSGQAAYDETAEYAALGVVRGAATGKTDATPSSQVGGAAAWATSERVPGAADHGPFASSNAAATAAAHPAGRRAGGGGGGVATGALVAADSGSRGVSWWNAEANLLLARREARAESREPRARAGAVATGGSKAIPEYK